MRTSVVFLTWIVSSLAMAACAVGITPDTESDGGDGGATSSDADARAADASEGKDGASTTECPGYAAPSETAACKCGSGKTCDANNCYGGYYCAIASNKCVPKPASCP